MSENLTEQERDMMRQFYAEASARGYDAASAKRDAEMRLAEWRAENDPRTVAMMAEWRAREAKEAAELAERQKQWQADFDARQAEIDAELEKREATLARAARLGINVARRTSL